MLLILPYKVESVSSRPPFATLAVIGVNAVVFLVTLLLGSEGREILFLQYGFVPDEWTRPHTYLTAMFLHGGWLHVIGNMYFLWIFGRVVEDRLGTAKYLALYFGAGVLATVTHLLTVPGFLSDVPCVGASGAISGMLGASMVVAAGIRVRCFYAWLLYLRPLWGFVELPSAVFLGVWFLGQLVYALSFSETASAVQVAYWAHIGGFVFGALATGAGPFLGRARGWMSRLKQRDLFRRAMGASRRGDLSVAAEILEGLHTSAPSEADISLILPRVYLEMGETAKAAPLAATALRNALDRRDRPGIIEAYYVLRATGHRPGLAAHDCLVLGRSFAEHGKGDAAAEILLECLRQDSEGKFADAVLFELGDIEAKAHSPARAGEIWRLLLELYPESKLRRSAEWRLLAHR